MLRATLIGVAAFVMGTTIAAAKMTGFGKDVCADDSKASTYCSCVGKTAYHKGPVAELPVGRVVGVVWKKKGSCRSKNCQILAPRDGYYLVVKDSMGQLTKDPRETSCK